MNCVQEEGCSFCCSGYFYTNAAYSIYLVFENSQAPKDKGVDLVACISVNDPFVMSAWGADRGVGEDVMMFSDGNCEFTLAIGLEMDGSGFGLGTRSQRYAMVLTWRSFSS